MSKFLTHNNLLRQHRKSRSSREFINPLDALSQTNMPIKSTLYTAQLFATIRHDLSHFLQNGLGSYCHILKLDEEQLVLAVPSAAIASKLRQSAPSIAAYLAQKGYMISKMNIKINAELYQLEGGKIASIATNQASQHRSQQCHRAFRQFLEKHPDSPLAPTIRKMLQKHTNDQA